ncbi:MAG TPA: DUF1206 domain-containing protein [Dermatophilaceae bacterium]|nr:DUF1206 domain-containing protein [Dermatophilaceae bacterium]
MAESEITETVRDIGGHPIVENGARVGYAVNGLVHVLIAWLALQLARGPQLVAQGPVPGAPNAEGADQSGAFATLAATGVGKVSLIIGVGGFALLALWELSEAIIRRDLGRRVKSGSKALLYLTLAWSCLSFVRGAGSSSKAQTVDITAQLMDRPLGQALVALVGAVILGIAGYHVYKGVKKRFLHDLREHPGRWAVVAGQFGYVAKGIALALVAGVFFAAAKHGNAAESTGLDGGLRMLMELPAGRLPLIVIALGFASYAVYSAARARYARV